MDFHAYVQVSDPNITTSTGNDLWQAKPWSPSRRGVARVRRSHLVHATLE